MEGDQPQSCGFALSFEAVAFTIDRELRDDLFEIVMLDLDAIGDIAIAAGTGRVEKAQEFRRRFEAEMRLLDDLR